MIVLDTNVVSNFMQKTPQPQVVRWLDAQSLQNLYLPSIVVAEIQFGLALLAEGKKRTQLTHTFEQFRSGFADQILYFDTEAAMAYGLLRAARQRMGKPISISDAQIAAIAKVHQCAIATRNTKDFEGCGIALLNPFEPM